MSGPRAGEDTKLTKGLWVYERGSDIAGEIIDRGEHDGEWRVALPSGQIIICLGENLEATTPSRR